MLNLTSSKRLSFGLDVSQSSVKVMMLEKKGKGTSVQGIAYAAMPKGAVVGDVVADEKTFSYVLKQALEKPQFGKINSKYVVASLPESKSFVRVIQVPLMSDSEIDGAVPFEAENFIPMPLDQVYMDWQKLGVTGDKLNILIIASPKEFVENYLKVLDNVGLKTVALEVESQSCHRALVPEGSKDTLLLADLQAFRSTLVMVEQGQLQFTSSIPIAGNAFTESIARALGVSSAKAEEIKRKVGFANTADYPNIRTSLLPILTNLAAEIKNVLRFHNERSSVQVAKVLLCGGSARLNNVSDFLNAELSDMGVKVELGHPWANLPNMKKVPLSETDALGFTKAIGLGLRGLDISI
ncbi:MAG: type IV pilus assembly protein PilM [Patescibacteria group bacterium]|nr:type IV pilus assembly protein PilM [Patescibacteria group bacterium]